MALAATVENRNTRGPQPPCRIGRIDGRVASADDGDAFRNPWSLACFVPRNELQRVDHIAMIVARNAEPMRRPEPDAQKQHIEFLLETRQIGLRCNLGLIAKL